MVRRLVQLASVESQTQLEKRETVDLAALIQEEIAGLSSSMETKKLSIEDNDVEPGLSIEGDPLMLRIAVRNILTMRSISHRRAEQSRSSFPAMKKALI